MLSSSARLYLPSIIDKHLGIASTTMISSTLHTRSRKVRFQLPTSDVQTTLQQSLATFRYHSYTLWLFIVNDIKTTLIPSFIFGMMMTRPTLSASCKVLTWLILHLLTFTIANQSKPSAVLEDKLNKPWRPLPAGRIHQDPAAKLKVGMEILSIVFSITQGSGAIIDSLLLMALTWSYNEFGDAHWFSRNAICAGGLATFAHGAASVVDSNTCLWRGVLLIAAVVVTTMQASDMYDQEGDRACGRKTIPLRFGDCAARWTLCATILLWSGWVCTLDIAPWIKMMTGVLGAIVSWGYMRGRTPEQDRRTFKFYCGWLMSIYVVVCS